MISKFEISFPLPVVVPPGWCSAMRNIAHMASAYATVHFDGSESAVGHVTIDFPEPTVLPDGFDHVVTGMVDVLCNAYEHEHHDRVMWPAGQGFRPNWSAIDAAFLDVEQGPSPVADGEEPTFDESVYCIDVAEREAHPGENKYHPDYEKIRHEKYLEAKKKREARPKVIGVEQMSGKSWAVLVMFDRRLTDVEMKDFVSTIR